MTRTAAFFLTLAVHLLGCSSSTPPSAAVPPSQEALAAPSAAQPHAAPRATESTVLPHPAMVTSSVRSPEGRASMQDCPPLAKGEAEEPHPCGSLACRAYTSPEAAISAVLTETNPRILAVGEAHLRAELAHLTSTTRRFSELLPLFSCRARHLVIELLLGRNDCGDNRVERTEKLQKPVTQSQANSNQKDFVELGFAAQRVGIAPRALTPSCKLYGRVSAGGQDSVIALLDAIGETTTLSLAELLEVTPSSGPGSLLLAYGGALHNDLQPRPGFEQASFAPKLDARTGGRLIELDLVLREQITDREPWTQQPFFAAYEPTQAPERALLYRTGPRSYTLVFPRSP